MIKRPEKIYEYMGCLTLLSGIHYQELAKLFRLAGINDDEACECLDYLTKVAGIKEAE